MKSFWPIGVLTALLLPLSPAKADDVITNIMSPIVSYQYPDNFSSAALTNGGIMSPIDSYQFLEWPGSGILNLQYSPTASYFWQSLSPFGSAILHGRVTDAKGVALSGVAVSANVLLTPER